MTYILEKYKGQTTRFTCPKCGRRHFFTRYIDFENNNSLNLMDKKDKKDTIDNNPRRDAIYRVSSLDKPKLEKPSSGKSKSFKPKSPKPSLEKPKSNKP